MPVAISGAGVAGPSLAPWLLRAGWRPTLVESATRLRTGGYMIDFWGVGWEWPAINRALEATDQIYFDRVSQIVVPSWSKGRVVLVGDAAACVSLTAGEGTGLAMTEAFVLAGEMIRAQDPACAFVRYEARIRPFIERKQRAARNFASSFAPRTRTGLWLRNQAIRLMALPGVPDLLVGRQMRDDFKLPDYEFDERGRRTTHGAT